MTGMGNFGDYFMGFNGASSLLENKLGYWCTPNVQKYQIF